MNNEGNNEIVILDAAGPSNILIEKLDENCQQPASSGPEDFSFMCRICALKTRNIMNLFEDEGAEQKLVEKINKYLPLKVSQGDGLPEVICYQCSNAVLAWHELVECCMQADASFRKQLVLAAQGNGISSTTKGSVNHLDEDSLKCKRSVMFLTMVDNVLTDYFKNNNIDVDNDWEYVCQRCGDKPVFKNVQCLSEHLKLIHGSELHNRETIAEFIENYTTFEDALVSDNEFEELSADTYKGNRKKYNRDVVCFYCECAFTSTRRLIFHLTQHIDIPPDGGLLCCGNIYDDLNFFEFHVSDKHTTKGINAHLCKACGYSASDKENLKDHIQTEHSKCELERKEKKKTKLGPKNQKNFPAVCPECNKTFSNKYNMYSHMKLHQGQKFDCAKCDKSYNTKGSLMQHLEVVHEGKLKYVCSSCGEGFPTRITRDVHSRLHTGNTPYECEYCGKSYRAKNTLLNHIKIHLDIRKYKCNICSKKFRKSTHLKYHVTTHRRKT
ncbi:zinc finger protein OZF-like isoform X2 [Zerene cesonia]|uniref:zinc finger protein OZF-like isoform X2 n=1 Tax=Zerene cesonia TaxID=33412 RepID=UPI0018E56407|nr:zinc finger protein OZF-like isoform X2 [Zerene cesonia]